MNDTVTSQSNCISTHAVSPLKQTIAMFLKNKGAVLGLMFLLLIVFVAIFGPFFIEEEPFSIVGAPFMAPMEDGFIFGTDYVGRDIFKEIVHGSKATFCLLFYFPWLLFLSLVLLLQLFHLLLG